MADPGSLRTRRHRLHERGDHSLCRHAGSGPGVTGIPVGTGWPQYTAEELQGISRRRWERRSRRRLAPGCRTGDHGLCELDDWHGTCSECGKTIRLSRSSAPPELRRCRDCQRENPRRSPKKPLPPRVCELCGETYIPKWRPRPGMQQRWCSKSCTTAWANGARPPYSKRVVIGMARKTELSRIRSQRRAETWDGVTDAEILERDRWRCGICGKRIGKSFKAPHPRSKSIDHIVPLSLGGDDSALNKRASHLGCNTGRCAGRLGEQMALPFGVEMASVKGRRRNARKRSDDWIDAALRQYRESHRVSRAG